MTYNYEFHIEPDDMTILRLEEKLLELQESLDLGECFFLSATTNESPVHFHTDIKAMEEQSLQILENLGYSLHPIDQKNVIDRLKIKIPQRPTIYGSRDMANRLKRGLPFNR